MSQTRSGRPSGLPETLKRWGGLFLGIFLIWVFIFVLAPCVGRHEAVRPLLAFIEESGIDAGTLFYTETKGFGEADNYLRNSFDYPPGGKQ